MIRRLNIHNFGSFHKFTWDVAIRDKGNNVAPFKKINILYGRNYSGKTTISRIIRSLDTGELPEKYENPSFTVFTDDAQITQECIPYGQLDIRVYNRDFIDEHLGFLKDSEGKITPFAVIGSENKTIEEQIKQKEKELGGVELETGLRYKLAQQHRNVESSKKQWEQADSSLKNKLTKKATQPPSGIKHNPIYKDPNYNTPKIDSDIKRVKAELIQPLEENERNNKKNLLVENPLPEINKEIKFTPRIESLHATANKLVTKTITPTQPIQELLNDSLLQTWVKQGITHHREKRDKCGFCGQRLPKDLWEKLDGHFSKESEELERSLKEHIRSIDQEAKALEQIIQIAKHDFYSIFQPSFEETIRDLNDLLTEYKSALDSISAALEARVDDIFTPQQDIEINYELTQIQEKICSLNALIENNNDKTGSLEQDQSKARVELRLSEVSQFILDIDYDSELERISQLEIKAKEDREEAEILHKLIERMEQEVEQLKTQLVDEKKGADKVNRYLNHYFGHEALRLEAVEDADTSAFKFQIMRGDTLAYNMSEGECSLVSFCYFMAKLGDSESHGKKLIIYIDDPISSLDSNHIFFVFSLIEALITRPVEDGSGNQIFDEQDNPTYRYEQLFLSTHNLEFLKYLKRLSMPKKDHEHFLVISDGGKSQIELMPDYLRKYITEFNYLFCEIYVCSDDSNYNERHHSFYNFGNNLRKFLEAYLFFKYPFHIDPQRDYNRRIREFFSDDPGTDVLVQRLTNEYSHLSHCVDRSVEPIDRVEIAKLASFVMKKIKDNDPVQFEYLLLSIDKPDPFKDGD